MLGYFQVYFIIIKINNNNNYTNYILIVNKDVGH